MYGFKAYRTNLVFYALAPIFFFILRVLINTLTTNNKIIAPFDFDYVCAIMSGLKGLGFTFVFGMNLNIVAGLKNIFRDSNTDKTMLMIIL